MGAIAAEKP